MKRRTATILVGIIPVACLTVLATQETIPFTDYRLTVPFAAEGPGPTYNTLGDFDGKPIIDITGTPTDPTTGKLNMTTVSIVHGMTLPQAISRWISTDDTFIPLDAIFPPGQSQEQVQQSNEQAFTDSESAATMAALSYLHKPFESVVIKVYPDTPAVGKVKVGQAIVAVDGVRVSSPAEVSEAVRSKKPGQQVVLTVAGEGDPTVAATASDDPGADPHHESAPGGSTGDRDTSRSGHASTDTGAEDHDMPADNASSQPVSPDNDDPAAHPGEHQVTVTLSSLKDYRISTGIDEKKASEGDAANIPFAGVLMKAEPANGVKVNFNLGGIGGPSAGLIFSLALVDKLSDGELTGGHFIAGTGTIDPDGKVGAIGGIEHKAEAARDAGAELFLSPHANCKEAISRDMGSMVVASVDTLNEAIDQINAFNSGGTVKTCQMELQKK